MTRALPRISRDLVKWQRKPNHRLRPKHREFVRQLPCLGAQGQWHLCERCAALPEFDRYRTRKPLRRIEGTEP